MAPIARTVGLLLLLPIAMQLAQYAAIPYGADSGPASVFLLLYGGYLVMAAFGVSFLTIGYQLSKYRVGSMIKAGALCATAYFIIQYIFGLAMRLYIFRDSWPIDFELTFIFIARGVAYSVAHIALAFGLGALGYFLHSRTSLTTD